MIIKTKKDEFQAYLEDTSNLKGEASLLYLPQDKNEIPAIISEFNRKNIPFTLCAGKTGTTGGCVPLAGAILSVENLKKINDIDKKNKRISLEAGVTFEQLEKETGAYGLTLRASPTESLACVGGAISTSASGVRGFGYGSIRNYVSEIDTVLPTGEAIKIKRGDFFAKKRLFDFIHGSKNFKFSLPSYDLPRVKSQAGYFVKDDMDLIDLFIGMEGTLGVITSCVLRLQDKPFNIFDGLIFFEKEKDAFSLIDKVKALKESGSLKPASLEFFDKNALLFLKSEYTFIPESGAAIYFEQEVEQEGEYDFLLDKWVALINESGALTAQTILGDTAKERERIFEIRHKLPQLINDFLRQHNQLKHASDIAVPWKNFGQMYSFYKKISQSTSVSSVNFGHIGESHLHFNFLPKDETEAKEAGKYLTLFCRKAVELGGTVSAEHGIGKIKKPYLKIMYSQSQLKEMAGLKKYFDPHCLLGLDNIFEKELLL